MNHDMVFWGVIVAVAGSALVVSWLLYLIYKKSSKGNQ
jgi:hypothetical protein